MREIELHNIKEVIDELYYATTDADKDKPNNIYFRTPKKEVEKEVAQKIKNAHISISHYLSYLK